jgi:hypothetical protein
LGEEELPARFEQVGAPLFGGLGSGHHRLSVARWRL